VDFPDEVFFELGWEVGEEFGLGHGREGLSADYADGHRFFLELWRIYFDLVKTKRFCWRLGVPKLRRRARSKLVALR
jgi:hypothetical protein